jgi:NADH-quinone oxidoreductase subunit J
MNDQILIDVKPLLFWIIAGLTAGSALWTLLAQNIVRSATWLLFTLAGTSGIFFLLGADFVGATQLLVYAGGTLVLVVFGVMLTAQGPFVTMKTSPAEWALSMVVGAALLTTLVISVMTLGTNGAQPVPGSAVAEFGPKERLSTDPAKAQYSDTIGLGFLGKGVGPAHEERDAQGKVHYVRTSYLLPFEIISIHLLVVLIGAAYLARAKRRQGASS